MRDVTTTIRISSTPEATDDAIMISSLSLFPLLPPLVPVTSPPLVVPELMISIGSVSPYNDYYVDKNTL